MSSASRVPVVAVVGSANVDVVLPVDRFPAAGETVLGAPMEQVAGGKGLNQAIGAARVTRTAFVARIGNDDAAAVLLTALDKAGVNRDHVVRGEGTTGRAFIQVTPDGENSIVVVPLANHELGQSAVRAALEETQPHVVLCQLEIPMAAVEAAADWAASRGVRFVLNASPVQALPEALIALCDPLVVNTTEAAVLLTGDAGTSVAAVELAHALRARSRSVVVTAGGAGAHVAAGADDVVSIPAQNVTAVDTTGAGDEFAGALAAFLATGEPLVDAAVSATAAASRVVQLPRAAR